MPENKNTFLKRHLGVNSSELELMLQEMSIDSLDELIKKVIPKNMVKFFDKKLLNLKNLKIVDLDHKALEFLELKGLLDIKLIKPIYLS